MPAGGCHGSWLSLQTRGQVVQRPGQESGGAVYERVGSTMTIDDRYHYACSMTIHQLLLLVHGV